jgi:hypothetical protein
MWWALGTIVLAALALMAMTDWRARKRGHRFRDPGDKRRGAPLPPGVETNPPRDAMGNLSP